MTDFVNRNCRNCKWRDTVWYMNPCGGCNEDNDKWEDNDDDTSDTK